MNRILHTHLTVYCLHVRTAQYLSENPDYVAIEGISNVVVPMPAKAKQTAPRSSFKYVSKTNLDRKRYNVSICASFEELKQL